MNGRIYSMATSKELTRPLSLDLEIDLPLKKVLKLVSRRSQICSASCICINYNSRWVYLTFTALGLLAAMLTIHSAIRCCTCNLCRKFNNYIGSSNSDGSNK